PGSAGRWLHQKDLQIWSAHRDRDTGEAGPTADVCHGLSAGGYTAHPADRIQDMPFPKPGKVSSSDHPQRNGSVGKEVLEGAQPVAVGWGQGIDECWRGEFHVKQREISAAPAGWRAE